METPIQADIKIRVVIETAGEGDSGHGLRIYKLLKELKEAHGGWRLPVRTELAFKCDSCSQRDPPAFECAFVLEPMETGHFSGPLVLQTVNVLEEIAMSRVQVPVSRIALSTDIEDGCMVRSYVESSQAIRTLGRVFERVLCTGNLCGNEKTMMDEVIISCSLGNTWLAGRLCTALATTRTTHSLQINFKHAPTFRDLEFGSRLWEVLAYSLFSKETHSSITEVQLTGVFLTQENADDVQRVIEAEDPARLVFGHGTSPPLGSTKLRRGTKITLWEDDIDILQGEPTWTLETDVVGVKVLSEGANEEEAVILIPGYGVCLVPHGQFIVAPHDTSTEESKITSLSLMFVDDTAESSAGLLPLLRVIGSQLTCLRLDSMPDFDTDILALFQACPNLDTLVIENCELRANAFVDAYNQMEMRISRFSGDFDYSNLIASALMESNSSLAKNLRYLRCGNRDMWDETEAWLSPLQMMSYMLNINPVLEYLEILVPYRQQIHHRDKLLSHHNRTLRVPREPFPIKCRLAFLSIFASSRQCIERHCKRQKPNDSNNSVATGSWVLARFSTDHQVLNKIFDFAAECVRRRVYLIPRRNEFEDDDFSE